MKVVIYARVSTDDKEQDPERQVLSCQKYCELHGHKVIDIIKEFHTGDSNPLKRPQGNRLLNREASGIVVWSMDRLTRQHPVKVIQMIQQCKNIDKKIISVSEPAFNMESEFSEIIMYIMSWFNNYFLVKLRRDTIAGQERARKAGKIIGRPKVQFNKYRAEQLILIEKKPLSYVVQELGVSKATLWRFKRGLEKSGKSYINGRNISKSPDLETGEAHPMASDAKHSKELTFNAEVKQ